MTTQDYLEPNQKGTITLGTGSNGFFETTLTLKNKTNKEVAFKLKATSPQWFIVKPTKGTVPANGEQRVGIVTTTKEKTKFGLLEKFKLEAIPNSNSNDKDVWLYAHSHQNEVQSVIWQAKFDDKPFVHSPNSPIKSPNQGLGESNIMSPLTD